MAKRRVNDFYPTPAGVTRALLRRVDLTGRVLECCSGEGHISNELARHAPGIADLITNDLDPRFDADLTRDAADPAFWREVGPVDWIVSNPPFDRALDIVEQAVTHARIGVAMLLRISFLEPTEHGRTARVAADGRPMPAQRPRAPFLEANPPHRLLICPRISFTGDGRTDSATVAWFVWYRQSYARLGAVEVIREAEAALAPAVATAPVRLSPDLVAGHEREPMTFVVS